MGKNLIVLLGPTGVGKTDLSIGLARALGSPVVSCDSRQIYKEMTIGTAVPTREQLAAVPHFFIQTVSARDYFNCWQFEQQALALLRELFRERDAVLMTGGSMMYIDAVCEGIDEVPDVRPDVREEVKCLFEEKGLAHLQEMLLQLDPEHYRRVDLRNGRRVVHAVEVCLSAGRPYSSFLTDTVKQRDFSIIKIGLNREREELYDRINRRVDQMVAEGFEEEARALYPLRHLNALNTVGYKEWFDYFDGKTSREEAIRLIKRNTRNYAKKQLSWFRRDPSIHWFHPDEGEAVLQRVRELMR